MQAEHSRGPLMCLHEEDEGIDLVPRSGKNLEGEGNLGDGYEQAPDETDKEWSKPAGVEDSGGWTQSDEGVELGVSLDEGTAPKADHEVGDLSRPPVLVGLQPSVVSLELDQLATFQVVATGDFDAYRLPIDLTFDPSRVVIEGFDVPPAIGVLDRVIDNERGLVHMSLVVPIGGPVPQVVATLAIRGLKSGPAPLLFSSAGAVLGDESVVPVAVSDGALYVSGDNVDWENR